MSSLVGAFESVRTFAGDESAATAAEYGLMASGIAVAIIVAVAALGSDVSAMYSGLATDVDSAI